MGDGVRVGKAVGGALVSGTVAAGGSKGIRGRKRPTAARTSASGRVSVYNGRGVRDGSG